MKVSVWLVSLLFLLNSSFATAQEDDNFGKVSYYSDSFQGKRTASGELYDKNKMTAAHKSLPFGTMVRVTRLDNKRSVQVRVNDRGPFIKGRIIELSRRAAEQIGLIQDGVANVKIEVVSGGTPQTSNPIAEAPTPTINNEPLPEAYDNTTSRLNPSDNNDTEEATASRSPSTTNENTTASRPRTEERSSTSSSSRSTRTETETAKSPDRRAAPRKSTSQKFDAPLVGEDYQKYDLYKINLMRPKKEGYGVQVASLTQYENVLKQIADLQAKWFDDILLSVEPGPLDQPVYKIILGAFPEMAAAENYKKNLKSKHKINGFVVNLSEM